jgi:rhodanese-related sulfurtransferase
LGLFLLGQISIWYVINVILIIIILWMIFYPMYLNWRGKRVAKIVDNAEFKEGMRKAQVIDVREAANFEAGHILGARNMPLSQFKLYENSLRKDTPIYIYETGRSMAVRAALQLHKKGYRDLVILKNGYDKWDGKTKKKKYQD